MNPILKKSLLPIMVLGTLLFACSARADLKSNLVVEVSGIRNQKGLLCLKLFSGSKGFPNGDAQAAQRQCVKIAQTTLTVTFNNLPSGSYAVAVYHDANGDRKLNRNGAGMPTEGYGFSNNPTVRSGPPSFGQAVILVAGSNMKVNVRMQYP